MFILGFALFLAALCLLPGQSGFLTPLSGGQAKPEAVQVHDDLLRFHVKAHSNSPEDQEVKNYVARRVLTRFQPEWSRCRSSAELGLLLAENSPVLESVAREILQECGFAYDVDVSLVRDVFPARFYEGKLYPPGEYAALYMVIGEGRGENWWCVLFPPLCFNLLPPLAADDAGENLPEDEQMGGNAADKAGVAEGRENEKGCESGSAAGEQEGSQRKWRFWLWEVFLGKKR
ncbi:MAG: stage II sporulation protein R [Dethiobacteria bacterium]